MNSGGSDVSDIETVDFPQHLDEAVEIWDEIAGWWDDQIGDGNTAQDFLIEPTQERLLDLKPGEQVLDVACGAGRFTRRMAKTGAKIVAFDHSRNFIERAKRRSVGYEDRIDFRVANAADIEEMTAISGTQFDAAVCTMGLMDMAVVSPLASSLAHLLKPGGRFVFSVLHPVFNSDGTRNTLEREFTADGVEERFAVWVPDYLRTRPYLGIGIYGQPKPHRYFHRPISELLRVFLDRGFALTGFEEPRFPPEAYSQAKSPLSGVFWREFPLVLVVRLELRT
ncbi:MAG: methyltransferase domain-containing protein [Chloroflexi bacterium]|nr:methyltransferase domain-containing protein [Chloroflexota bacterium]